MTGPPVHATARDPLLRLSVLGLLCGLLIGCVMIAFRMVVEGIQGSFLPGGDPENYEALSAALRFGLPVVGGILIGLLLQWVPADGREVGPSHVLDCIERSGSRLPLRNALVQFAGGALSIISGQSVGREGPAIHLGAATASLTGQALRLSPSALRSLTACGVAAAIAASFNTPLAGVVFAMEVVVMEYSVAGFAPVILAAVSATMLNRVVYGGDVAFAMPPLRLHSLWELPYVLGVGAVVGLLSAAYIALLQLFAGWAARIPFWMAVTLGGFASALCALVVPQVMGIGYDTVDAALLGRLSLLVLVGVAVFKLVATTAGVGLGLPGGLIGPMLVTGAAAGGALGIVGGWLFPQYASSPGFYALVGMGAMMAGTLHAPLAALTAMLELTGNPNIIWPGMLAAIAAFGVSREIFRQEPVFVALLRARRAARTGK
jgi:H+/Cl- antiporter ClcA